MSVLLIGENQLANYQSPYFSTQPKEISLARKERKAKQQQYRIDLFEQMKQKQQRHYQQHQKQHLFSRRYERSFPQQPFYSLPDDRHKRALSFQTRQSDPTSYQNPFQALKNKQAELEAQYPYVYSQEKQQVQQSPFQRYRKDRLGRLKTDNTYEHSRLDSIEANLQKRESRCGSNSQQYQCNDPPTNRIKTQNHSLSNSSPKYYLQRKYPQVLLNPEEPYSYQRLPPIVNRKQKDSDQEWREWFAKEKLKELECYYHKFANSGSSTPPPIETRFRY